MLPASFTPGYLRQLELLKLRARRSFLGSRQGGHLSLKKGHGIEFSDYRKYELGDDPRHIDWGVYARNERLYVKRFQEEQDLPVFLIVDGTASMHSPSQDGKWSRAVELCLSLAYVAFMQHDSVRVCVPGSWYSPLYSGGRSIHRLSRELADVETAPIELFLDGVRKGASQVRFPGIAVVISDFLMPLEELRAAFNLLRAKNLDISAIQILGRNDLAPLEGQSSAVLVDSETGVEMEIELSASVRGEYSYLLEQHNEELSRFFHQSGISFLSTVADETLKDFVFDGLTNKGLLQ